MSEIQIRSVDAFFLWERWEKLEPMLKKAYFYTEELCSPQDLLVSVAQGRETAWIIEEEGEILGVATTEILKYPRKLVARVNTLAGEEMKKWFEKGMEFFEAWARELGVEFLEIWGRPGFKPWLKKRDFRTTQYLFVRNLENGRK